VTNFLCALEAHLLTYLLHKVAYQSGAFLAPSANLPKGLYILSMFFSSFLNFFMFDFLPAVSKNLLDRSSPKFKEWYTDVRACSPH